MNDDTHEGLSEVPERAEITALRAELERDPNLRRARADEIWVRARVDEIVAEGRPRPWRRMLAVAQVLALDAAAGTLTWWLLGPEPTAQVYGLALSKPLIVALAVAATHTAATLGGSLRLLRD